MTPIRKWEGPQGCLLASLFENEGCQTGNRGSGHCDVMTWRLFVRFILPPKDFVLCAFVSATSASVKVGASRLVLLLMRRKSFGAIYTCRCVIRRCSYFAHSQEIAANLLDPNVAAYNPPGYNNLNIYNPPYSET